MKKFVFILLLFFFSPLFANIKIQINNNLDCDLLVSFPHENGCEKGFCVSIDKKLSVNIKTKNYFVNPSFYLYKDSNIYLLDFIEDFYDQDCLSIFFDDKNDKFVLKLDDKYYYSSRYKIDNKWVLLNSSYFKIELTVWVAGTERTLKLTPKSFYIFNSTFRFLFIGNFDMRSSFLNTGIWKIDIDNFINHDDLFCLNGALYHNDIISSILQFYRCSFI